VCACIERDPCSTCAVPKRIVASDPGLLRPALRRCVGSRKRILQYGTLLLNQSYPERTIIITSSERRYVKPEIKAALRRKNTLMRLNKLNEANALTDRIGAQIIRQNTTQLRHLDDGLVPKELWDKVKQFPGRGRQKDKAVSPNITVDTLNEHYVSISTNAHYIHCRSTNEADCSGTDRKHQ
jgi:hypothetical protein